MPEIRIPVLGDEDMAKMSMARAVACMEKAFQQKGAGTLAGPARVTADMGSAHLAFTCGAFSEGDAPNGFRVYDLLHLNSPERAELNVVFDGRTGALRGLVTGPYLGQVRTGAIGGVAVKYLANPGARVLSFIGTGRQARTQLPAILAVHNFEEIRAFCRSPETLGRFIREMSEKIGQPILPADSAEQAAREADVLVCSTTSKKPVICADWLKPGVHINTLGLKFKDAHEVSLGVIERCDSLFTDTLAQMEGFGEKYLLHGTPHYTRVIELSEVVSGDRPARNRPEDITLFHSLGLAGTEVLLANELIYPSGTVL